MTQVVIWPSLKTSTCNNYPIRLTKSYETPYFVWNWNKHITVDTNVNVNVNAQYLISMECCNINNVNEDSDCFSLTIL